MKSITGLKRNNQLLIIFKICLFIFFIILTVCCNRQDQNNKIHLFKPNRVLVIIGDQWKDPGSFFISENTDFKKVVVLLKSWCVPFDIIRMDEEKLDIYHFVDHNEIPVYGTIIWIVPETRDKKLLDIKPLHRAVNLYGIGLIVLGESIHYSDIQSLLGIRLMGKAKTFSSMSISSSEFITENSKKYINKKPSKDPVELLSVKAINADVLAKQGDYPILTLRKMKSDSRCIWISTNLKKPLQSQIERRWLRRALAEINGYFIIKTWENHIILRMDDPGAAQNAWLKRWHYPTLSLKKIRKYLLEPLKQYNAKLTVFAVPGFVNDNKQSIEPSWQQRFVDRFGTLQDYPSTKSGLDEGISMGLIEIQSHGWTHMQPDLDSFPGPWWGSALETQRANEEWYREFNDGIRGKEISASIQMRRMKISCEWLERQFGQYPVAFIPGGYGISTENERNTWKLAARVGFGWLDGYLGKDLAVAGWLFNASEDVPDFCKIPPDGHDFGVTRKPDALKKFLKKRGKAKYITYAEYIAYLHASVQTRQSYDLAIHINFQDQLSKYLVDNNSQWTILLSNWLRKKLGTNSYLLKIDNREESISSSDEICFTIPAGEFTHKIVILAK